MLQWLNAFIRIAREARRFPYRVLRELIEIMAIARSILDGPPSIRRHRRCGQQTGESRGRSGLGATVRNGEFPGCRAADPRAATASSTLEFQETDDR